jgi:hypothetical protein
MMFNAEPHRSTDDIKLARQVPRCLWWGIAEEAGRTSTRSLCAREMHRAKHVGRLPRQPILSTTEGVLGVCGAAPNPDGASAFWPTRSSPARPSLRIQCFSDLGTVKLVVLSAAARPRWSTSRCATPCVATPGEVTLSVAVRGTERGGAQGRCARKAGERVGTVSAVPGGDNERQRHERCGQGSSSPKGAASQCGGFRILWYGAGGTPSSFSPKPARANTSATRSGSSQRELCGPSSESLH